MNSIFPADWSGIAMSAVALVALSSLVWLVFQRSAPWIAPGKPRPFRLEDWQPRTMRPLTPTELHAFKHVRKALPECLVMPQVALARFLNVTESRSYNQWFGSVGRRCVDFLVCAEQGDVLGVIQLQTSKGKPMSEGARRKIKALEMAQIPVWMIAKDDLPDAAALRALVMPELQASAQHSQQHGTSEESVWQATKLEPRQQAAMPWNPMQTHRDSAQAKLPSIADRWDQAWPTEDARSSDFLDEFGMIEVPPVVVKGSGRGATGFTR